ncbi:MAG: hypothetical protein R3C04_06765 [Hyphomonas sp.]
MGQISALCETAEFHDVAHFPAQAAKYGLTADGGSAKADPDVEADLVSSSWIASTDLGARSTIWRGTYGPGEIGFRKVWLTSGGSSFSGATIEPRAFERAESCVAHSPALTRQDGLALATAYGLSRNSPEDIWDGGRNAANESVVTSLRRLNGSSDSQWVEIEFKFPANDNDTGVTIVRRHFFSS